MASKGSTSKSGGFLFALAIFAGVGVGGFLGEPSLGFLVGAGAGLLLLVAVWLIDRRG